MNIRCLYFQFFLLFVVLVTGCSSSNTPNSDEPQKVAAKALDFIPAGISIQSEDNSNTLSWPAYPQATAYTLYVSTSPEVDINQATKISLQTPDYHHTDLQEGVIYYYTYAIVVNGVESFVANEVSAQKTAVPAEAAENVKIYPGNERITLTWSAPQSAAVENISHYHVFWNNTGNVTTADEKLKVNASPAVHTTLTNGDQYYYRIAAVVNDVESELSHQVSSSPHVPRLSSPIKLSVIAGDGQATLNWTPLLHAESYTIYWNQTGDVSRTDRFIDVTQPPFVHNGLQNGKTYYYKITANNNKFSSALSRQVSAKPAAIRLGAPQNVTAVAGNRQVTIQWDEVKGASLYNLYWATDEGGVNVQPNVQSPFLQTNLTPNETVRYQVSAVVNGIEGLSSAEVSVVPLPDPTSAPVDVVVNVLEDGGVIVSDTDNEIVISYNLYWNLSGNVNEEANVVHNVTLPYVHSDINLQQPYYYWITAVTDDGESLFSPVIKVANQLKALDSLSYEITEQGIVFNWQGNVESNSYHIYWSTQSGFNKQDATKIANVIPGFVLPNLQEGQTYYFAVSVENENGESELTEEISVHVAETLTLNPVQEISVTPGNGKNTINFSVVENANSYLLYWSTTAGQKENQINNISSGFEHSGLTNGQTYYYILVAVHGDVQSEDSIVAWGTPVLPVPATPSQINVNSQVEQLSLSWPVVPSAVSYNVYWQTMPGVSVIDNNVVNVDNESYVHTNLNPDNTYYYKITAVNASGEGLTSNEVSGKPGYAVPAAPQLAAKAGDAKNTLSWSAVDNATSYTLYWSTNSGGKENVIENVVSPYEHNKLTNGQTYYYILVAINGDVHSDDSNIASVTPMPPVPTAPTGVKVTQQIQQLTLTWSSVETAASYNIYWQTTPNVPVPSGNVVNTTDLKLVHAKLDIANTYYYKITAVNMSGESVASAEVNGIPLSPLPNAPVIYQEPGVHEITLFWEQIPGAIEYNVFRDISSPVIQSEGSLLETVTTSSLTLKNLDPEKPYYYAVSAVNSSGEGDLSNEIWAAPLGILLGDLVVSDVGFQECITNLSKQNPGVFAHRLNQLSCSERGIEDVTGVGYFINVVSIDFTHNLLTNLDGFRDTAFPNLEVLWLWGNYNENVKGLETADLPVITVIDLGSNNQLTSLAPLNKFTSLNELYLTWDGLVDLNEIPDLVNLTTLKFDSLTPFTGVLDISVLVNFQKAVDVDLSFNNIEDYSSLQQMSSLRQLWLIGNQLDDLQRLGDLSQVTHLYLNSNNIKNVSALASFTELVVLDLVQNQLGKGEPSNILELSKLVRAEYIYLAGNVNLDCGELIQLIESLGINSMGEPVVNLGLDRSPTPGDNCTNNNP